MIRYGTTEIKAIIKEETHFNKVALGNQTLWQRPDLIISPTQNLNLINLNRNSQATYIDENGNIQIAAPNELRVDYSNGFPEILIEPEKTNLNTGNFNTGWTIRGSDVYHVEDKKYRYERTNEGWSSWIRQSQNAEGLHSFTLFAKYSDVQYLVFLQITSANNDLSIDLINGEVAYKRREEIPVSVTDAGNGWWKIQITSNIINYMPYMQLNSDANGMTNSSPSNIGSVLLKMPQTEEGLPTSYIPTETEIATRLEDVATIDVPEGTTEIIEVVNGIENIITEIPNTYQLPQGRISEIQFKF